MLDHKEAEVLLLQQDKLEAAGMEVEQEDRMLEVDVEGLELKDQDSLLEVVELSLKSVGHREMLLSYFEEDVDGRDLVIRTSEGLIHCHRLLLAGVSPLFKRLLSDESPDNELSLVVMTDFNSEDVRNLVSTAYGKPISESINFFVELDTKITVSELPTAEGLDSPVFAEDTTHEDLGKSATQETIFVIPDFCEDETVENCTSKKLTKKKRGRKPRKALNRINNGEDREMKKPTEKPKKAKKYPVSCQVCSAELLNKKQLDRHKCNRESKENVENSSIICHECGISFENRSQLANHLSMKCENVCYICKAVLATRTEVREHMLVYHHKIMKRPSNIDCERPFPCSQCSRACTSETQLKAHMSRMHTDQQPIKYQCQECGKLIGSKLALKKHVSLHKPPGLGCPICGKLFHNKSYLSRHVISQHGEQADKRHKCDMCDKGFNNRMALEGHRNWHLNLKPYQCRWCDKTYQNSSNCFAHERKAHSDVYESSLQNGHRRVQAKNETISVITVKEDQIYIV